MAACDLRLKSTVLGLLILVSFFLIASPTAVAREGRIYAIRPPYLFFHNIGNLTMEISNVGAFGNPWGNDSFGAGWRGGEYLYAAGVWIGAIAPDNLPYVSTCLYEFEILPSPDPVDTIYESYEGIPGGNRIGFSDEADDDGDGITDEEFHNGKDEDADGLIDEDYCAISEQMYSCEYWDYTPEAIENNPEHRPLYVKVRQRSMAWSIEGINEFIGVELEIINEGFETLRYLYVGVWVDSDVGPRDGSGSYWTDDGAFVCRMDTTLVDPSLADCDSLPVRIEMAYMYDIPDNGDADGGDVEGFFGLLNLGCTIDPTGRTAPVEVRIHTARVFSGYSSYPEGDPGNDFERYDALSSGVIASRPTVSPDDYRFLVSVGPFPELLPGESFQLHFAFVVGEGYYDEETNTPHPELGADGLPDEHSLLANAIRARLVYEGRWKDIDGSPETGVDGRETCIATEPGEPFVWVNPCDSTDIRVFEDSTCDDPDSWVDNDCNPCTPNPFHEDCAGGGCERLIHWYILPVTVATPEDFPADGLLSGPLELTPTKVPAVPPIGLRLVNCSPMICQVRIYNVHGRLVRDLGRRRLPAGVTEWIWDGRDRRGLHVPPGFYFARAAGDGAATARQFILLRR